jgi:hypothetical protein
LFNPWAKLVHAVLDMAVAFAAFWVVHLSVHHAVAAQQLDARVAPERKLLMMALANVLELLHLFQHTFADGSGIDLEGMSFGADNGGAWRGCSIVFDTAATKVAAAWETRERLPVGDIVPLMTQWAGKIHDGWKK